MEPVAKTPMTDERLKLLLGFAMGFLLLFMLGVLAFAIAIGKVEEKTSYGLYPVISCIGTLGGTFAGWAFGTSSRRDSTSNRE